MKLTELITEEKIKKADLILIRGIPGSGKSSLYETKFKNKGYKHVEADMFHINKDGEYKYNPDNVKNGHMWCQKRTRELLESGKKVVVSNTFVKEFEMKFYFNLAEELNKSIQVIRMTTQFKSIHNVPEKSLNKMKKEFIDVDNEINSDKLK